MPPPEARDITTKIPSFYRLAKRSTMLAALLSAAFAASSCEKKPKRLKAKGPSATSSTSAPVPGRIRWKGVLMTGDDAIVAFDNARRRLKKLWISRGVRSEDIRELSRASEKLDEDDVELASADALAEALKSLAVKKGEGCLVHLTSHGSPWGFYLRDQPLLTPSQLDEMLTASCGNQPTVIFVSACYSGVFTGNVLKRKNRVLLTAARDDRNSFGCGVEDVFTFWDGCVIQHLASAQTPRELGAKVQACIREKERATKLRFSFPQIFVGKDMEKLTLFAPAIAAKAEE